MLADDRYFNNREFREILAAYESKEEAASLFLDADDLTDIADYYTYVGNSEKAKEVIKFALDKYPGASGPLVFKTREALRNEDVKTAEDYAEKIDDKEGIDYYYIKAEILVAQDRISEAESIFNDYLSNYLEADNKDDFRTDIGEMYIDYGVFDKAYDWLSQVEDKSPIDYKELMGKALLGTERTKECIELLEELLDKDPYNANYWNTLAATHLYERNFEESLRCIDYALAIAPKDSLYIWTKANCFYEARDFEDALTCYLKYCDLEPNSENGELKAGSCLVNMSRFKEALIHLKRAEMLAPADSEFLPFIYEELAFAHGANGESGIALDYAQKATECGRSLDKDELEVIQAYILLGNGELEKATEIYHRIIRDSGYDPSIILRVIVSIQDHHYYPTAYKLFKKLFAIAPKDFNEGYAYMAACCRDMHKDQEFLQYLEIAVERNPQEASDVLGAMFPQGMNPKDYFDYIKNKTQ